MQPIALPVLREPVAIAWAPRRTNRRKFIPIAAIAGVGLAAILAPTIARMLVEGRLRREIPKALAETFGEGARATWDSCEVSLLERTVAFDGFAIIDSAGKEVASIERLSARASRGLSAERVEIDEIALKKGRASIVLDAETPRSGPTKPFALGQVVLEDLTLNVRDPEQHALSFLLDRVELRGVSSDLVARGDPVFVNVHGAVLDAQGQRSIGGAVESEVAFLHGSVARAHGQMTFEGSDGVTLGGGSLSFTREDLGEQRTVARIEGSLLDSKKTALATLGGTATVTPAWGVPTTTPRNLSFSLDTGEGTNKASVSGNMSLSPDSKSLDLEPRKLLVQGFGRLPGWVDWAKEKLSALKGEVESKVKDVQAELDKLQRQLAPK